MAGPYPRTETSCRNLPVLGGKEKKIISQFRSLSPSCKAGRGLKLQPRERGNMFSLGL